MYFLNSLANSDKSYATLLLIERTANLSHCDMCRFVYVCVYLCIYIYVTVISLNYTSKSEIWGRLFKYSQVPSTHGKNVIKISLKKGNLQSLKNYY